MNIAMGFLKDDEELVGKALEQDPRSIAIASDRLKNKTNLILKAATSYPKILDKDAYYSLVLLESGGGIGNYSFPYIGNEVKEKINKLVGRVEKQERESIAA